MAIFVVKVTNSLTSKLNILCRTGTIYLFQKFFENIRYLKKLFSTFKYRFG